MVIRKDFAFEAPPAGNSRSPGLTRVHEDRKRVLDLISALKQCSKARDLEIGKQLHLDAVSGDCHKDKFVAAALITMYSKCCQPALAREVFDDVIRKDVVMWNSIIQAYVENGEALKALDLFASIDCEPTRVTYLVLLKACVILANDKSCSNKQVWLRKGIKIHKQAQERGFESDIVVANTLMDMYSNCGEMGSAREIFEKVAKKDVVMWNCLILGYVENGESSKALDLFASMDCEANRVTYLAALKACAGAASGKGSDKRACLKKGVIIHNLLKARGFEHQNSIANTLVDMYSKCREMELAQDVFDNMKAKGPFTWTSLMLGYVKNDQSSVALQLFERMDCEPTHVTYLAALKACAGSAAGIQSDRKHICLHKAKVIHKRVRERGFDADIVMANTLVDAYAKCGDMKLAREVFDNMVENNVVSWNCLISGYVENGESSTALELFTTSMDCCQPDSFTCVPALKACGNLAMISAGRGIHAKACRLGLEEDEVVATALVDLYCKCGSVITAAEVFNSCIGSPNIVSWTALIAGHSLCGDWLRVLSFAEQIEEAGLRMNGVTFVCILTACSHAGLMEEGKMYFEAMQRHGVNPTLEHYTCLVDMFGRANRLEEAFSIVKSMPFQADSVTWTTLLGACGELKDLEVGRVAFDALVRGDKKDAEVAYLFARNISF